MIEKTRDVPVAWDAEYDLVVAGSGGAGMTGAVVATVEGASAVVLEKTELVGGTTSVSGGGFWIPLNHHTKEVQVDDNREDALAYMRASAGGAGDDEVIVALVDNGHEMIKLLEERAGMSFRPWPNRGGTIDYRPELPGSRHGGRTLDAGKFTRADLGEWSDMLRLGSQSAWLMDKLLTYRDSMHTWPLTADLPRRLLKPGEKAGDYLAAGSALAGQLLKGCLEQGVTVLLETPVKELVVDGGRVVGVRALREGKPFTVKARHGVLMATGGYAHNEELKRLWLDRPLDYSCESPENKGDGHLMGMAIGAQLAGLGDAWWMMQGAGHFQRYVPHTMVVDRSARRFVNEAMNYYDFGMQFGSRRDTATGPAHLPAWLLFDNQAVRKYSAIANIVVAAKEQAVVVEAGASATMAATTLTSADTPEELAAKLSIDGAELKATIERFNGFARAGRDPDFHRGEGKWAIAWGDPKHEPNPSLGTLEEAPFYAVEIRSGALATRGGLRVNANGEVLSAADGRPIPGLYAAGNCSSGATALSYPGPGSTLGAAMTFGYIVGERIAAAVRGGLVTA
jgi:3-oxosteroid 1-dehydrogenase